MWLKKAGDSPARGSPHQLIYAPPACSLAPYAVCAAACLAQLQPKGFAP